MDVEGSPDSKLAGKTAPSLVVHYTGQVMVAYVVNPMIKGNYRIGYNWYLV